MRPAWTSFFLKSNIHFFIAIHKYGAHVFRFACKLNICHPSCDLLENEIELQPGQVETQAVMGTTAERSEVPAN